MARAAQAARSLRKLGTPTRYSPGGRRSQPVQVALISPQHAPRFTLFGALALLLVPSAAAAQDPCSVEKRAAPAHRAGTPRPPLLVGDSGSLLAVDPLVRLGIEA